MADLSGLNLLRNDPDKAAELIAQAERGDMDAQYAAGLIYAEGRGVAIDLVQAYYWLTSAIAQGDSDAEAAETPRGGGDGRCPVCRRAAPGRVRRAGAVAVRREAGRRVPALTPGGGRQIFDR